MGGEYAPGEYSKPLSTLDVNSYTDRTGSLTDHSRAIAGVGGSRESSRLGQFHDRSCGCGMGVSYEAKREGCSRSSSTR